MKGKKTIVLLSAIMLITSVNLWAQQQITVAVRAFTTSGGFSQDEGNAITDIFTSELLSTGRITVVDRDSFDAIIAEMRFGASEWSNNDNVARLGRAINANYIIQGTVALLGGRIVITVRVLNISTVTSVASPNLQLANMNEIFTKLPPFVRDLALTLTNSYRVGEVGPSGGYVFYDKGSYSDGWRYLECAPANYELDIQINGDLGSRLYTMNINRLTGWRIPTPDELNLMYGNLKQWNLGGFRDDWYYSSNRGDHAFSSSDNDRVFHNFSDGMRTRNYVRIDGRDVYISSRVFYIRAVRQF
jgi:TolB-like protein